MIRDRLADVRAATFHMLAGGAQRGLGLAGYRAIPSLTLFADDTLLVSYPRSGNTWVRFLVANLIAPMVVTFANIEDLVPDIYVNSDREMKALPQPRILKSHSAFDPRYKRVIYLVRDPRDVVVSYYHYHRKTRMVSDDYPLELYVNRFMSGDLDPYGTWREHVGGWLGARGDSPSFLLVRYEDLLQDTYQHVKQLAAFLRLDVDDAKIAQAVELSEADRMRGLEAAGAALWRPLMGTRDDVPFIRAGAEKAAGGPPPSAVGRLAEVWASTMRSLGYGVDS